MSGNSLDEEIRYVEICKIKPSPFQPRRIFSSLDLEDLAASIKTVGIIHPPLVRALDGEEFELLAGERRLRASELAGLTKIPVIIKNAGHELSAESALIENIQRVDLNALEISKALKALQENFKLNQEELAKKVGKKRSTIANYLRLLALPKAIQESISNNLITMGHAKAILALPNETLQEQLHQKILSRGLTVREAEAESLNFAKRDKRVASAKPANLFLAEIERKLSMHLGTRVSIKENENSGTVSIDYYSLEDLDRLLGMLNLDLS